jgi:hypothetical protein
MSFYAIVVQVAEPASAASASPAAAGPGPEALSDYMEQ